jgi:hypothetical protein
MFYQSNGHILQWFIILKFYSQIDTIKILPDKLFLIQIFYFLLVLWFELKSSHLLGRLTTTWATLLVLILC